MRALRYYGLQDIRLDEIPEPECRPGHVKIKPSYVGICGSDIHLYFDEHVANKPDYSHPLAQEKMPIVFGHEFGGVITELGDDDDDAATTDTDTDVARSRPGARAPALRVGDLVAVRPSLYDDTCGACLAGHSNVCRHWGWRGIHASGGLAEAAVVPRRSVFRVDPRLGPEVAALVEPLAVGWHATRLLPRDLLLRGVPAEQSREGNKKNTTTVFIAGGGPIGCAVFLALVAQGVVDAERVVVSEVAPARRALLRALGARHVVSPDEVDVAARVREVSRLPGAGDDSEGEGAGADAAFDCAGLGVTLETALAAVRARGTIVNVAVRARPVQVDLNLYLFKEATLVSSSAYVDEDWEGVIEALGDGRLRPEAMITRKIGLEDLVEKGIKKLAEPGQQDCKILIDVQGRA